MPYPNSQSPVTLRLNALFANLTAEQRAGLINNLNMLALPLAVLARTYTIVSSPREEKHLRDWPAVQQDLVRAALVRALMDGKVVIWDWEEATTTSTSIIDFGALQPMGITLRSPQIYPPYSRP